MKKIITFSNFIALLGIVALLVGFAPAIAINGGTATTYEESVTVNLFQAAFGANNLELVNEDRAFTFSLLPCIGAIIPIILLAVAIALNISKMKLKYINLLSFAFYLASAILFINVPKFVEYTNIGTETCPHNISYFAQADGLKAVYIILFVAAGFALIEFFTNVIKPKQKQEVY